MSCSVTIKLGDGRKVGAIGQTYYDPFKNEGGIRYRGFDGIYKESHLKTPKSLA